MHSINNIHVHGSISIAMLESVSLCRVNPGYQHTKLCHKYMEIIYIIFDNCYQLYNKVNVWWKTHIFTWKSS